jgi:hypothetical protein
MLAYRAKNTIFPFWEDDIFACRGSIPEPLKSVADRSRFLSRFASAVCLPEVKNTRQPNIDRRVFSVIFGYSPMTAIFYLSAPKDGHIALVNR